MFVPLNEFQNEITAMCVCVCVCVKWQKKYSWQVHKAKLNVDTNVLKSLPKIMTRPNKEIHYTHQEKETKTEKEKNINGKKCQN